MPAKLLQLAEDFTVSLWFHPEFSTNSSQFLFAKTQANSELDFGLAWFDDTLQWAAQPNAFNTSPDLPIKIGEWNHVVVICRFLGPDVAGLAGGNDQYEVTIAINRELDQPKGSTFHRPRGGNILLRSIAG